MSAILCCLYYVSNPSPPFIPPSLPFSFIPFLLLPSSFAHTDIQTRNYYAGLEKYNQMVTTGSFSEIGSFIPGLKVLLQLALQLNI